MQLARVDGNIVSTIGHSSMKGCRLLICQPINETGEDQGVPVIAIDTHGAGLHSRVFMTTDGSSTQLIVHDKHSPLRNMILGVVDEKPSNSSPL